MQIFVKVTPLSVFLLYVFNTSPAALFLQSVLPICEHCSF